MMPPIAKMDNTLSTLKAAKHISLSSNVIEKITGLKGCESCEILSLGRNQIKKLDGTSSHDEQSHYQPCSASSPCPFL